MELKERLVQLRKDHGLSQNDLAEKLNVSRQAISRWEQGTVVPSSDNLIFLSQLYGITLDELICGQTQPKEEHDSEKKVGAISKENTQSLSKKAWQCKKAALILICILLISAICGLVATFVEKREVYPMDTLEKNYIDLTTAGNISGHW